MNFIQLQNLNLKSAVFPADGISAESAAELAAKSEIQEITSKLGELAEKDVQSAKLSNDQTLYGKNAFKSVVEAENGVSASGLLAGNVTIRQTYDTFGGLMAGMSHSDKDKAVDGIAFTRIGGTDTDPLKDQGTFVKCVGKVHTKDVKVGVYGKNNSEYDRMKDLSGLQMIGDMADNTLAQGYYCFAPGHSGHAEGMFTVAGSFAAHAEGTKNYIVGPKSESAHAEGILNILSGDCSYTHVEGSWNTVIGGAYNHVEGADNLIVNTGKVDDVRFNHVEGKQNCISADRWTQINHVDGTRCRVNPGTFSSWTWSAGGNVDNAFIANQLKAGVSKFEKGQIVIAMYQNGQSYGNVDEWKYECLSSFTWNGEKKHLPPWGSEGEGATDFWKPLGPASAEELYPYPARSQSFSINPYGKTMKEKLQHVYIGNMNLWDIIAAVKSGTIS